LAIHYLRLNEPIGLYDRDYSYFEGPFTLVEGEKCLFQSVFTTSSGIYLWTIKQDSDNTHLIHYVGETVLLGKRHREHLIQILGLNYGIFDPDKARQGVSDLLWKGLWRDKTNIGPLMQLKTIGQSMKTCYGIYQF
jgi:hypothetical protein